MEAAAKPLPSEDTTPPVTKTYFAAISSSREIDFLPIHAQKQARMGAHKCVRLSPDLAEG
jgi:hypothetical protein